MTYPLISEYKAAILAAEDNLATKTALRPVCDSNGEPIMTSGNYAVVFKMEDTQTGRLYAVKCFLRDQERRESSYEKISRALSIYPKIYWTSFQYLEKELFVDSRRADESEFPIVLMDWIDGTDLGSFVDSHYRDSHAMAKITYEFCKMAKWICGLPIAHGDVKPDNVIVSPDYSKLMLVDYDGMYVPEMEGEEPRELGSPNFRHPFRDSSIYDSYIDDFSFALICMSLRAITLDPTIYEQFGGPDYLILKENDLANADSKVKKRIREHLDDPDLCDLSRLYDSALQYGNLRYISLTNFAISNPEDGVEIPHNQTSASFDKNGEELLSFPNGPREVHLIAPLKVIRSFAFMQCANLSKVYLPDTLEVIEADAFYQCRSLTEVHFSSVPKSIGRQAFHFCMFLRDLYIPKGTEADFEKVKNLSYYRIIEE